MVPQRPAAPRQLQDQRRLPVRVREPGHAQHHRRGRGRVHLRGQVRLRPGQVLLHAERHLQAGDRERDAQPESEERAGERPGAAGGGPGGGRAPAQVHQAPSEHGREDGGHLHQAGGSDHPQLGQLHAD